MPGRTVLSRSSPSFTIRSSYATSIPPDARGAEKATLSPDAPPTALATDDSTSILNTTLLPPTDATTAVDNQPEPDAIYRAVAPIRDLKYENFGEFMKYRSSARKNARSGTRLVQTYDPNSLVKNPPDADSLTLPMLLANQTHLGHHTSLWNPANSSYIFGIREGIHIISPDITFAYLKRAAKVVQEVARRGGIILIIGTRKGQMDVVIKAAKRAGGYHIFDRWVPGTLTNGQQLLGHCTVKVVDAKDDELKNYSEVLSQGAAAALRPDLVICLNPIENEVVLRECGVFTVPTIGIIDTDANPTWVTYPIPANDDSHRSVALIAGVLSRAAAAGQKLRMEAAERKKYTYDPKPAQKYIQEVELLNSLNVNEEKGDGDG
jgi:small subunit ribosomal protein S2